MARQQTLALDGAECQDKRWFQVHREDQQKIVEILARLLAQALELEENQYRVTFQSRFGPAQWLEPYTEPTLQALAREGVRRVDVVTPGFVADCLETLEEIGLGARDAFLESGGQEFHLLPCLNESPDWIVGLAQIALEHPARPV